MAKRDGSVSLLRLIGMLCVLLCHVSSFLDMGIAAHVFYVGVPLFMLISGYLYGDKPIHAPSFLRKRYVKLTVPAVAWVLVMALCGLLLHAPDMHYAFIPMHLLNLEGLWTVFDFVPNWQLFGGTGNLWFFSILWLAYLSMLAVKKTEARFTWTKRGYVIFLLASAAAVALLGLVHVHVQHIWIFFVGYGYKKAGIHMRPKLWLLCAALTAVFTAVTLLLYVKAYKSLPYETANTFLIESLAFLVFASSRLAYRRMEQGIDRLAEKRAIRHADAVSFYVYIVHSAFLFGAFSVDHWVASRALQLLLFAVSTVCAAELLRLCMKPLQKFA